MGDLFSWILFFMMIIGLLGIIIYQTLVLAIWYQLDIMFLCLHKLMCLADLEFDYINPYDSADRINKLVFPEYITQGVLCLLYLLTGHWIMSLLSVPYLYHNVTLYMQKQHLIDVTEIFNLLNREKKQRLFKLGYLIFLLCVSLFWTIWSALEEDERTLLT